MVCIFFRTFEMNSKAIGWKSNSDDGTVSYHSLRYNIILLVKVLKSDTSKITSLPDTSKKLNQSVEAFAMADGVLGHFCIL